MRRWLILLVAVLVIVACREERPTTSGSSSAVGGGGAGVGGGGSGAGGTISGDIILQGTIVTPDVTFDGQVLIEGETITCVAEGTACEDSAAGATVVETGGVIAPGLIDTHNHILFDIFDESDWAPNLPGTCVSVGDCSASSYCGAGDCDCVDGVCRYTDHDEWPKEDEYALMLDYKQCLEDASQGKPVWCPQTYDGDGDVKCEMDKWGELKGLIAATTSIVGLPGNSSKCFGSLSRSIDVSQNDLPDDKVQTSALFPPSSSSGDGVCANFTDGDTEAYLIHCGEGVSQNALDEFQQLFDLTTTPGCLYSPQTTITHGTAFGANEFAVMATAGMKLTWSPASNLSLYGVTTDIPAALAAGLLVSLAPDWSMGGSQNLLDELRVAKAHSDAQWGGLLTDRDLVDMVTVNAAAVLGLADRIGRLEAGYLADVVVVAGDSSDPYGALVAATPADVSLVMVGGVILYGDVAFEPLAPTVPGCTNIDICGSSKFLCVAEDDSRDTLDQTYAEVETALRTALEDLDSIQPVSPALCNNACATDESCFLRTVHATVDVSQCGGSCAAGEDCFQTAMSGNNQFNCLSVHTCYAAKTHDFAPLTPLVQCN